MALNTSPTRTDVGYLRRRTKPSAAPDPVQEHAVPVAQPEPAVQQPAAHQTVARPASSALSLSPSAPPAPAAPATARPATSSGLSLGRPSGAAAASAPAPSFSGSSSSPPSSSAGLSLGPSTPAPAPHTVRAVPAGSLPFAAPSIDDVRELGDDEPVLRLNPRESAIGSLIVTGAASAVWEDHDRVTGAATSDGATIGSPVTTSGNRPLVGFDDSDAIVSLRHVASLRRALFIGRGPEPLGVQIFDGSTVTVSPGDEKRMFVLYLLRIGSRVELRAEPVDRAATDESIHRQFAFTLTPFLVTRASRSR